MSNSPRLRCAIYTRKSSEEGLEQEFNSLDAQRDACEAFIASQAGLCWKLLTDRYDDGGVSGGTLARPALQRLLDDIRSGRVDVVVVYKIDRLTRSLTDFAKIVEVFDERSVSFVSITQSFNTTSSMGRLTLNVLLSFAQFEREVTGERIRDKIAASKRKGMWMGGVVPLGYDVRDRKLEVNSGEAATVRQLFALYLELGSIRAVQSRTQQLGLVTKRYVGAEGVRRGGLGFSCGHLRAILTNPIYVGMIRQGKELHKGLHDPILDQQTFDLVRDRIAANANTSSSAAGADGLHLLTGLIFDETGDRLSPSHATKKGKRYRYYVSRRLVTSSAKGASKAWRLSAAEIEKVVQGELLQFLKSDTQLLDAIPSSSAASADLTVVLSAARATADELQAPSVDRRKELVTALVQKVVLNADCVTVELSIVGLLKTLGLKASETDAASTCHTITIPIELRRRGIETRLVVNNKGGTEASAADPGLLDLLRQAHRLLGTLTGGSGLTMAELAERERMDVSDLSRVLRFAFLAPDICQAIVEGRQPTELTRKRLFRLSELPNLWAEQRMLLGF